MAVTLVVRLADCRHERVLIGFLRGPHPHPFQRRVHLRSPEAHRPADLEIGDQPKLRPGKVMERFTMQHRRWLRSEHNGRIIAPGVGGSQADLPGRFGKLPAAVVARPAHDPPGASHQG